MFSETFREVAKINKAVIEDETTFAYVTATTSLNAMAVFSWDSAVQHGKWFNVTKYRELFLR